jgi:hypothetical protein
LSMEIVGAFLAQEFVDVRPSVTTWSRLEPHPATPDIAPGLAAQIADPLWLLHRQWAFGELQGEDAGSPIDARLVGSRGSLGRYHPGPLQPQPSGDAVDYEHADLPLEVLVEREPVRGEHVRLSAALGLHFLRLLVEEGASDMRRRFAEVFPVNMSFPDDPVSDRAGADWAAILGRRALDGDALAAAVRPLLDSERSVTGIPTEVSIPMSKQARVLRALTRFMADYDQMLSEPEPGEEWSWQSSRQEYAFALSGEAGGGHVVLRADEYSDGHLDWWAFRASISPQLGEPATPKPEQSLALPAMFPTPVRYPGMPADRYWEFEDGRVNLGGLDAGPSDLGRLLLVEYGLIYGNDWWLLPVDLPIGSLFSVTDLRVVDTFGVETTVTPSRNDEGSPWEMFELSQVGRGAARLADLFFLPPTLVRRLEGDPIERVTLLRDEMANLAWGVEHIVQGDSGEPIERALEAARMALHQEVPDLEPEVGRIYRLMSSVPVNWIPFEPVATRPPTDPRYDLAFERRVLLRTVQVSPGTETAPAQLGTEEIHPKGRLLRSDPSTLVESELPLRIAEEEIPRDGAVVTRSFQYARWLGGRSFLWLGRTKRTGRGEGWSGLRYDSAQRTTGT